MHVLVTGATGFVGRNLVPELVRRGHHVRAGTRRPESYRGEGEPVAIDLLDRPTLGRALDGCDAAFYLVHSMQGAADFARRDRQAAVAFRDEAAQRGLRVVYLGGLGDRALDGPAPAEDAAAPVGDPAAPVGEVVSEHLQSRYEVGHILRDGADTVELQAAVVVGAGSVSFEILRQLVDRLPVMVCPRWVTTRCQPIAIDDVVSYLAAALDLPAGSYQIGGADVLTYEEMMRSYARLTGRHRLILRVPVLTPGLSSHWIGLITDQPASLARPLAEGLSVEVVVRDPRIRQLVDLQPMGFEEAVRRVLAGPSDHPR